MKTTFILSIIITTITLMGCSVDEIETVSKVNFPSHIYLEKKSPDGKINAVIYSWSDAEKGNISIGSEDRFILGLVTKKSKWYVDYELSEGFGTYEGSIIGIQWLNDDEVLIKRQISDRSKDIKYNIRSNEWNLIEEKE